MPIGTHRLLWGVVAIAMMAGGFFLVVLLAAVLLSGADGFTQGGAKLGVVSLEGVISSDMADHVVQQLSKYADEESIKAIVLRIDSPGGGVAASQEIYDEVKRTRAQGKPVVASFGSVAASGGYYVACVTDRIFADPGSLTGSIGVIIQLVNAEELLRKIGVEATAITSGSFKDSGSPARALRPEERQVFQALVDDVYQQFVEAVAQGRQLPADEVRRLADGRVYTGRQAKDVHLVDELGSFQDAVAYAAAITGITGKPKLVQEGTDRLWWLKYMLDSLIQSLPWRPLLKAEAVLQYRWLY